jgi:amino acid adenylation domain-containing protein
MDRLDIACLSSDGVQRGVYPLTSMQQAYWIGEQNGYRLGTAACLYRGYRAGTLELERLEQALLELMATHPALRTRILPDGTQCIAQMPARCQVPVRDIRHLGVAEQEALVTGWKEALDEHLPDMADGCQFACHVDRVHDGYRLHFLFRLLTLDGRSLALFFHDLTRFYRGDVPLEEPVADYREYVEQQHAARLGVAWRQSLDYWTDRLHTLPPAPDLPIRDHEDIPRKSTFHRLQARLEPADVQQLTLRARRLGATLNAMLCALFADVLRRWSRSPSFTLNLLISGRPADDSRFDRTIGNFSNTLLLEVPLVEGGFRERVTALQKQLFREIEHRHVSGVDVIRQMNRPASVLPAMPVVFASTLGLEKVGSMDTPSELGWLRGEGSMHTPQVWLDHQAYMEEGRMFLNWDYVGGVFLPGVIEDMFATYQGCLQQILQCDDPASFSPRLQPPSLEAPRAANDTARPLPDGLLHDFFVEACRRHPAQTAIIAPGVRIGYGELLCRTTGLASEMRQWGVACNDLVAIVARRGWRQVAAAMATVQAGAAYLPVAYDLPPARMQWLIEQPGVKVVLCERDAIATLRAPEGVQLRALEDALPDDAPAEPVVLDNVQRAEDLAYVIFTSGSTGTPKGVAITHRGAVNTLQDVIARFGLDNHDRVLGISAFNFDLSVYDIFATLGCGATLVLPPHSSSPSPADWAQCIEKHGVTVWNSVPALLEMQLEFSVARAPEVFSSLRLIMLSGDWIPVSLPGRVARVAPHAAIVGLGGATEASIWSNYFVIDHVDPRWRSIPYGWPLSNQSFHVLDDALQPRPAWAVGHLYIGGIGLAQGYYKDSERTSKSFVTCPDSGERLYRTGDLGRYQADGRLEFLGRSDTQVKIHGHRIELGEIDAMLERCPGVRSAASLVRIVGEHNRPQLLAFFVRDPRAREEGAATEASIRQHLGDLLPHYMVPGLLVEIDHMPMTVNGKIDRATLQKQASALQRAGAEKILPRDEVEAALSSLWEDLLDIGQPGVHDDFFALGGSSLMAVRLLNAIESTFGQTLTLASLLRQGTIATQARLIGELAVQAPSSKPGKAPARDAVVIIRRAAKHAEPPSVLVAVHPVGGNVLCYRELLDFVPEDMDIIGIQSRGDGGARTVADMAASYVRELAPHLPATARVHLFGWSMGGVIAHEMAGLLESAGVVPAGLTMIDSWVGEPALEEGATLDGADLLKNFARDLLQTQQLSQDLEALATLPPSEGIAALRSLLDESGTAGLSVSDLEDLLAEHKANFDALIQHRPRATGVVPLQFKARRRSHFPFLVPFSVPADGLDAPRQVHLDETHFSIARGDSLRRITAQVLGSGSFA